jgi:hypothetical protein
MLRPIHLDGACGTALAIHVERAIAVQRILAGLRRRGLDAGVALDPGIAVAQIRSAAAFVGARQGPAAVSGKGEQMKIAMIGLRRMGANMALRILGAGHQVVASDHHPERVDALVNQGPALAHRPSDRS